MLRIDRLNFIDQYLISSCYDIIDLVNFGLGVNLIILDFEFKLKNINLENWFNGKI